MSNEYKMTISRLIVDKLGVKLYDRVSAVIAEIVANSYDADATEVEVTAPIGEYLATKANGNLIDRGYTIEVKDNGIGMKPEEINPFYLVVGGERRPDKKRGELSKVFKRKVMGRKGVGKLAPFGVCQNIELLTSGGEKITGKDENGKNIEGYSTAHLTLRRSKIIEDTETDYKPDVGQLDGCVRPKTGTIVKLTLFDHRRVPDLNGFERQLARRFGVASSNWSIRLIDSLKTPDDENHARFVGEFEVEKMENTEIKFEEIFGPDGEQTDPPSFQTVGPGGETMEDISPGFEYEGIFYPVMGWVAYSKHPYRDDLMAGVRIYCRGKIAAQTHIFNMKAGFTGEYDIRSYLVGELHANWLDEAEDLIRTDRQDILWSHELGREFEKWGKHLVKKIGIMTKESGSRGFFSPSPHTTRQAGPHRAVHLNYRTLVG